MCIGIMGAMIEEVDSIKKHMTDLLKIEHGSRDYYTGKINGTPVVLTFSRWGKVAAATTVTSLITEFKINKLVFTGVAGAVSSDLNIGDIVISDRLYQHDMDPSPLFPKHQIPLTGLTFFLADEELINKAKTAVNKFIQSSSLLITKPVLNKFGIETPRCVVGMIGSGDQFIASCGQTQKILAEQPETLAVEMEGGAIAQVCYDYQIPFVVLRTISDRANHDAPIDFPVFINQVSRLYAENIIINLLG